MANTSRSRKVGAVARRAREQTPARTLTLCNQQHLRRLDLRLLRRIVEALLQRAWPNKPLDLAVNVVGVAEITRLNETFLRHKGSTDVITFDYGPEARMAPAPTLGSSGSQRQESLPDRLHGELFVCMDEAVCQARRFGTNWQSELVRYTVHGVLHLIGYDDQAPGTRAPMKKVEEALLLGLSKRFALRKLGRSRRRP
jgi:probable rRNA maturation factor